jgi:hypothetical protein
VAEDLAREQPALPAAAAPPLVEQRKRREEESRLYRSRFALAYLALAVVAGIGIGGAIVLYDRAPEDAGGAWAAWKPTGDSEGSYPRQIADQVANRYKLPSGNRMVGILASKPQIPTETGNVPIQAVAIVNDETGEDISIVETQDSAMYTLCGRGQQCSIAEGDPSAERLQLLRRQALELALYSFKYIDGLDSVITLLPPNLGDVNNPEDDQSAALFFRKGDFEQELDRPLERTLDPAKTPSIAEIPNGEAVRIDRLTNPRLFQYEFQQTQVGTFVIFLAPVLQ